MVQNGSIKVSERTCETMHHLQGFERGSELGRNKHEVLGQTDL